MTNETFLPLFLLLSQKLVKKQIEEKNNFLVFSSMKENFKAFVSRKRWNFVEHLESGEFAYTTNWILYEFSNSRTFNIMQSYWMCLILFSQVQHLDLLKLIHNFPQLRWILFMRRLEQKLLRQLRVWERRRDGEQHTSMLMTSTAALMRSPKLLTA